MTVVLLALDETAVSGFAVARAHALFGADATYLAVNVARTPAWWAPPGLVWGGVTPYAQDPSISMDLQAGETDAAAEAARDTAGDLADQAGIAAAPIGEVGDPVEAIARAAEEHGADVIVVGSGDKGFWRKLMEGSVSTDVVRIAERPVLVVPYHDPDEDRDPD